MLKDILLEIFQRDLNKLKTEIESYSNESNIWFISKDILNSGGNLCLHINGNLKHFVGAVLGKSGYIRDREREFKDKNIPRKDLLKSIDETIDIVNNTIESIPEEMFSKSYPVEYSNKIVTTENLFLQLATHLNYHLGQINYHRRLIDK
ncbi:MAG: DinB superfamily protein [Ignavibacteria bacterium RBG_16_34_14]|nr:MAG: DinB superfamily protein [Ignavibacteria bacterium RBG_16_34_14]